MVLTRSFALAILSVTIACGGGTTTPTVPAITPTAPPAPPPPSPLPDAEYEVMGTVIDDESRPLADAAVAFVFVSPDNPSRFAQPQVRTDAAGNYRISFAAAPAGYAGSVAFARANKDGYEADNRWFRAETDGSHILNFHLYRSRRITAGETTTVAIALICRTVRIMAPIDGVMTIEAISVVNGTHPSLTVETVNASSMCGRSRTRRPSRSPPEPKSW